MILDQVGTTLLKILKDAGNVLPLAQIRDIFLYVVC